MSWNLCSHRATEQVVNARPLLRFVHTAPTRLALRHALRSSCFPMHLYVRVSLSNFEGDDASLKLPRLPELQLRKSTDNTMLRRVVIRVEKRAVKLRRGAEGRLTVGGIGTFTIERSALKPLYNRKSSRLKLQLGSFTLRLKLKKVKFEKHSKSAEEAVVFVQTPVQAPRVHNSLMYSWQGPKYQPPMLLAALFSELNLVASSTHKDNRLLRVGRAVQNAYAIRQRPSSPYNSAPVWHGHGTSKRPTRNQTSAVVQTNVDHRDVGTSCCHDIVSIAVQTDAIESRSILTHPAEPVPSQTLPSQQQTAAILPHRRPSPSPSVTTSGYSEDFEDASTKAQEVDEVEEDIPFQLPSTESISEAYFVHSVEEDVESIASAEISTASDASVAAAAPVRAPPAPKPAQTPFRRMRTESVSSYAPSD